MIDAPVVDGSVAGKVRSRLKINKLLESHRRERLLRKAFISRKTSASFDRNT